MKKITNERARKKYLLENKNAELDLLAEGLSVQKQTVINYAKKYGIKLKYAPQKKKPSKKLTLTEVRVAHIKRYAATRTVEVLASDLDIAESSVCSIVTRNNISLTRDQLVAQISNLAGAVTPKQIAIQAKCSESQVFKLASENGISLREDPLIKSGWDVMKAINLVKSGKSFMQVLKAFNLQDSDEEIYNTTKTQVFSRIVDNALC